MQCPVLPELDGPSVPLEAVGLTRESSLGGATASLLMPSRTAIKEFRTRARAELRTIAGELGAGHTSMLGDANQSSNEIRSDAELRARVSRSRELRVALLRAHSEMNLRRRAELWSVAWSPCGRYVVTGSEDRTARIIVADTERGVALAAPSDSDLWWDAAAPLPWRRWDQEIPHRSCVSASSTAVGIAEAPK